MAFIWFIIGFVVGRFGKIILILATLLIVFGLVAELFN